MKTRLLFLLAVAMLLCMGKASASTACPTPSLTAMVSDTLICSGTPDTFVALPVNAFAMTYQWYKNGVATGTDSIYIDALLNDQDSVWLIMTSTCAGTYLDTSVHFIISVNPTPPVPSLSLSGGACLGSASIGTIVGGSATQVNWYNSGSQVGTQSLSADTPVTVLSASPSGLCQSGGNLYVSDQNGDLVYKVPDLSVNVNTLTAVAVAGDNGGGTAANQIVNPRSVFVDRNGYLYVCDLNNDRIQQFPPGCTTASDAVTVAGGNGTGAGADQFNGPIGIYVDSAGYIYVADVYNYRVQKFPPGSTSATAGVTVAGGNGNGTALNQMYYAEGVYLDHAGNIYVADGGNNRILMFPPNSTSSTMGTVVGGGNGLGYALNQLYFPRGVTVDALGNVYATDQYRIMMYPAGNPSTSNGIIVAGYSQRGANDVLSTPIGSVAFDSTGAYMFVDDDFDNRVRRYGFRDFYTPPTAGSYTATYTSALGCTSGMSNAVTVNPSPVVTLSWDSLVMAFNLAPSNIVFGDTTWCTGFTNIFTMQGGLPLGGTYTGGFIANNTFNSSLGSLNTEVDPVQYTFTNLNGCSATAIDTFYINLCEGINTIPGSPTISLYPNPNNGSFILQSSEAEGREYIITDMIGRVVAQDIITSGQQGISLDNVSAGSYILQVRGSGSGAVRFVVE